MKLAWQLVQGQSFRLALLQVECCWSSPLEDRHTTKITFRPQYHLRCMHCQ